MFLCWAFLYFLRNESRIGWNAGYGIVGKKAWAAPFEQRSFMLILVLYKAM